MSIAVQHLDPGMRATLMAHFLALPTRDRSLRFGRSLASEVIAAYVNGINFARDAVFGVLNNRLVLVGVVHVAFEKDCAELGLSVLPAYRGLGIGNALFERAAAHARNRSVPRLFMHFLAANAPIMRIARRFGMQVVADDSEADARLELAPASMVSIAGEFVTDTFARYDRALKALVATWKHQPRGETPVA